MAHRCVAVIPARLGSSRFPSKVLAEILNKPMIQYVWEAASKATELDAVLIASEDKSVVQMAQSFGAEAVMTPNGFCSGTDRVSYVMSHRPADIIVNIQADEPLLRSDTIDALVRALREDASADMATLAVSKDSPDELNDPNVVKLVASQDGRALYFSRQPLKMDLDGRYLKHIGVYAYRRLSLERFARFEPTALEQLERLEQLRALENGMKIRVVEIKEDLHGVDTPEDLVRVKQLMVKLAERHPL